MDERKLDFLMGATSPTGFCGYYSQILKSTDGTKAALLKAAPGCGKSTLLRKLAQALMDKGETVELIHCSADPDSLDGVICPRRKLSVIDATAPHNIEPLYPVAFEDIVSLYHAVDRDKLQSHREEIVSLYCKYKGLCERTTRYITAAGSLIQDSMRVVATCTNLEKARSFARTLSRKYIPSGQGNSLEEIRLLSAITLNGQIFYSSTVQKLASNLVVLEDEFGVASKAMLYVLRDEAMKNGYDIITCYCSMSPYDKIEHLFIPALSLGFCTSNEYHPLCYPTQRTIHCTRFCDKEGIKLRRKRLRFNKKAVSELFFQTSLIQKEAKICHDEIEAFYIDALDTKALDDEYEKLISLYF
ncbi:MAG: hypothetical protein RR612_06870 [Oscillospiraceae bacterium]